MESTFLGLNEVHAVLLTAALAAIIAIWGIISQRAITARQTTLEFINNSESDRDLISARETFNEEAAKDEGLAKYARDDQKNTPEAKAIRTLLNQQELIAIAIQRGILDDKTYRRYFKSGVIKTWQSAAPYVFARRQRTGNAAIYHEFEELARWYQGNPPMPKRQFFWAKFF